MKTTVFIFILSLAALFQSPLLRAQAILNGYVSDSITGEKLSNVNISIPGTDMGTVSDVTGHFEMKIPSGDIRISFTSMGYLPRTLNLDATASDADTTLDFGNILLSPASIGLAEVDIIAAGARERQTPVAVTTIQTEAIERRLGDNPYPEVMKMVPGVYATRQGGGSGDASVNIRGFKQENVALLLNGIPISSVENGLVYWNNWLGLTEATQQVQVQRGLGASNVALNSVGGTINIITKTTNVEKGGSFTYSMTDYGNLKSTLMLSTGRMKNDLAITFLGSYFTGPGYADATYVKGFAYFLSVSKEFGRDQMLVFTAMGNPEKHGQRNFKLSDSEVRQYGLKYNKDWGSYNGRINNASENFYHKPHLSLNHYWNITEKDFLATSVYFSTGKGGGKWTETFGDNPWIFSYYNPGGQIDWETIYRLNSSNQDTFRLADGRDTTGFSNNIQTNFLASHVWTGLLSTYKHTFSEHLLLTAGIHGRYFRSSLQQKVRDLLGGDFFIDDYAWAIDGVAGRNQVKNVGDIVKIDNGAVVNLLNLFGQLEYKTGRASIFLAGSAAGNWYRRIDRYNYANDPWSEWVFQPGFDVKGGLNFNLNEYHNIYFNAGYFSTAPYYKFVFGNYTNVPTKELRNEKVATVEAGYGFRRNKTTVGGNAYITQWKDKAILTNEYNQFEDPAMLQGLDALHLGLEAEIQQQIGNWGMVGGIFSLGEWKWKNDVTAYLLTNQGTVTDTVTVFADGLYVGDAPQTQLGLVASVKILKMFNLDASWIYYDDLYADFNPARRTNSNDTAQSYRIPSYYLLDLHLGYPFNIGSLLAYGNISCYNVLNSRHIIRGEDGYSHDLESFTGFWGFGRTFNFSLKISF